MNIINLCFVCVCVRARARARVCVRIRSILVIGGLPVVHCVASAAQFIVHSVEQQPAVC